MFTKRYQLQPLFLDELSQQGMRPQLLSALKSLEHKQLRGKARFLQLLEGLSLEATVEEKKLIVRYCQLSWLPLERWISNRLLREWIEALVFAIIVASLVRFFLFAPFKIPSSSMEPTLLVGDHLFATRYAYGIPLPFSQHKLLAKSVERGDIVIFPFPQDPSLDYIKRVVALGGETIAIQGQQVYLNGQPLSEPYAYHDPLISQQLQLSGLELPNLDPVRVPLGHVFVMGDNRFSSSDSRVWGFLEQGSIKAKASRLYWSHDSRQGFLKGYQLNRIGKALK